MAPGCKPATCKLLSLVLEPLKLESDSRAKVDSMLLALILQALPVALGSLSSTMENSWANVRPHAVGSHVAL